MTNLIRTIGLFLVFAASAHPSFAVVVPNLRQAVAVSRQTARPIFAVYGEEWCPYCVRLMSRLQSDESLRRYGDQFVIVRVDTKDPDWRAFDAQYSDGATAVPRLYFVSPSGERLDLTVGAPSGNGLPRKFDSVLAKSGSHLDTATMQKAEAIAQQIDAARVPAFPRAARLGEELAGLLARGNQASPELSPLLAVVTQLRQESERRTAAGLEILDQQPDQVDAVADYALFALLRNGGSGGREEITRALAAYDVESRLIKTATPLAELAFQAAASDPRLSRVAATRLERSAQAIDPQESQIAARYLALLGNSIPATSGREAAPTAPLASDNGATAVAEAKNPDPERMDSSDGGGAERLRTWTSADGKFTFEAVFVGHADDRIRLRSPGGREIEVPLDRLSDADRQYSHSR